MPPRKTQKVEPKQSKAKPSAEATKKATKKKATDPRDNIEAMRAALSEYNQNQWTPVARKVAEITPTLNAKLRIEKEAREARYTEFDPYGRYNAYTDFGGMDDMDDMSDMDDDENNDDEDEVLPMAPTAEQQAAQAILRQQMIRQAQRAPPAQQQQLADAYRQFAAMFRQA